MYLIPCSTAPFHCMSFSPNHSGPWQIYALSLAPRKCCPPEVHRANCALLFVLQGITLHTHTHTPHTCTQCQTFQPRCASHRILCPCFAKANQNQKGFRLLGPIVPSSNGTNFFQSRKACCSTAPSGGILTHVGNSCTRFSRFRASPIAMLTVPFDYGNT